MTSHLDPSGCEQLLIKVLRSTPKLDDAACIGRHELFDGRHATESHAHARERGERARALCDGCPARAACTTWAQTEPNPTGHTIAGHTPEPAIPGRPRKAAS